MLVGVVNGGAGIKGVAHPLTTREDRPAVDLALVLNFPGRGPVGSKAIGNANSEIDIGLDVDVAMCRYRSRRREGVGRQVADFRSPGEVGGEHQPIVEKVLLDDGAGFEFLEPVAESRLEIYGQADRIGVRTQDPIDAFERNSDEFPLVERRVGSWEVIR